MNIQIFGSSKSFDTKKAERWFKERRIRVQSVDVRKYGMSLGELTSVRQAVGLEAMVDPKHPDPVLLSIWPLTRPSWTSCSRILPCSALQSSETGSRPLWATAPKFGCPGPDPILRRWSPWPGVPIRS